MSLSNVTRNALYTIGHSNHDLGDFLAILVHHGVETLCDVRSRPGSFRFPQFNREPLEAAAALAKIEYQFLGESLGGRPDDPRVYRSDGLVDYVARRKSPDFAAGVDGLLEFSRAANLALMCAEEDPLQCHRFLMPHRSPGTLLEFSFSFSLQDHVLPISFHPARPHAAFSRPLLADARYFVPATQAEMA